MRNRSRQVFNELNKNQMQFNSRNFSPNFDNQANFVSMSLDFQK